MFTDDRADEPTEIGFLLLPRFSLLSLLSAIEPLRGANRTLGRTAYRWRFISIDGASVAASNCIPVAADAAITDAPRCPTVFVLASYDPLASVDRDLLGWLRRYHRAGGTLVGVESGPEVLARAGLLDGRRATLHWETLNAFREQYPAVDVRDALYEIDGPIVTCSGGAATFDLILNELERRHARSVASSVSEQFLHSEIRRPEARQRLQADLRAGTRAPEVARAVDIMEQNVETPLSLAQLAAQVGIEQRRLARKFVRIVGIPPHRYYTRVRLARAQELLQHGGLAVSEVALATGFASSAHFARVYRARYGRRPSADRPV